MAGNRRALAAEARHGPGAPRAARLHACTDGDRSVGVVRSVRVEPDARSGALRGHASVTRGRMRTRCAAAVAAAMLASAHAVAQAPPPAPEPPPPHPPPPSTQRPRPPTRHMPYRGTASAPTGADTLDVHSILKARTAALDSALQAVTTTFDTLGLDSLVTAIDRGGAAAVDSLRARRARSRRLLRVSLQPVALSTYDRVNGLRLGSGVEL